MNTVSAGSVAETRAVMLEASQARLVIILQLQQAVDAGEAAWLESTDGRSIIRLSSGAIFTVGETSISRL